MFKLVTPESISLSDTKPGRFYISVSDYYSILQVPETNTAKILFRLHGVAGERDHYTRVVAITCKGELYQIAFENDIDVFEVSVNIAEVSFCLVGKVVNL